MNGGDDGDYDDDYDNGDGVYPFEIAFLLNFSYGTKRNRILNIHVTGYSISFPGAYVHGMYKKNICYFLNIK